MKPETLLQNDLYRIIEEPVKGSDGKWLVKIEIDPEHRIFKGHFPGNPVLPGVCTVQMIKEMASVILNSPLRLRKATNIKYSAFINPLIHKEIWMILQWVDTPNGFYAIQAIVFYNTTTFCSLKGELEMV